MPLINYHILLTVLWILYGFIHSLMASLWFKKKIEELTRKYYKWYRLFYSCFATLLLVLLIIFQYSHQSILLFDSSFILKTISVIALITGVAIMVIAIKRYFFMLSGVAVFTNEKDKNFIPLQQGINAHMRHPLYSGTLLVLWSLFFLFPFLNNLIACAVITIYTLIGIKLEEYKLILEFGELYRSYQEKVPMLIPSLHLFR